MREKPKSLNEIWPEKDLCEQLDLPVTKSGRSRQLSNWIRGGLKFVEKSERRYFSRLMSLNTSGTGHRCSVEYCVQHGPKGASGVTLGSLFSRVYLSMDWPVFCSKKQVLCERVR